MRSTSPLAAFGVLAAIGLHTQFACCACGQTQSELFDDALRLGTRAYFAGRADQAEEHLTAAIEQSPADPRPYYFRGLNRVRQGQSAAAEADISRAARLEAEHGSSAVVEQALASVQGPPRLTLERVRREARRNLEVRRRTEIAQQRRAARLEQEKRVLRTEFELPLESLASRLTPTQAQRVAVTSQEAQPTFAADSLRGEPVNPFADDRFGAPIPETSLLPAPPAEDSGDEIPLVESGPVEIPAPPTVAEELPPEAEGVAQFFRGLGAMMAGETPQMPMGMGGGLPMGGMGVPLPGGPVPGGEFPSDFDEAEGFGEFGDFEDEGSGEAEMQGAEFEGEALDPGDFERGSLRGQIPQAEQAPMQRGGPEQAFPEQGDSLENDGFEEMEDDPFDF